MQITASTASILRQQGSNAESAKVGFAMNQNAPSSSDNPGKTLKLEEVNEERDEEEEEEEEEDADFIPFLKETLSHEASSSLSSEDDGLDGDVVNSGISVGTDLPKLITKEQICAPGDSEHGEDEIILQSSGMVSRTETDKEKHIDLNSAADVGNGFRTGELTHITQSRSPIIDIDNEDAICMRTRARFSLEGFSLDELETFLQETDDDDDPQNADDEEEYKKFLAAVLQDGNGDGLSSHENENPDDDEDNDADFELELEELLESDGDENAAIEMQIECDGAGRRPETRQKKRQKAFTPSERNTLGQIRKPLRPILPNWLNGPLASGKGLVPEATSSLQSSPSRNGLVNGFTPQQIGQLYCLIHEHVQLLIQVFSLSVLEPSHKQIASQVQGLLCEMLHKRDEVLASQRAPYPGVCFTPSLACTSVSDRISNFSRGQCNVEFASTQDAHSVCFPQSHQSSFEGLNGQRSCFQNTEGSFWFPFVGGPVRSILDVAPLNLVRRYVDDIHSAAQEFRKRYIESSYDSVIEKEPLFPFSSSIAGANTEVSSGIFTGTNNTVSTSPGQKKPKKTLAAMLIESTKKQSIALVPKEVAKLTQRFSALFNPALFPHKPPPAAVVNRMLFTDSEDELLALGILEYNTDWKAIQQRFLPCKSKHQIFVRQKNRCSSKASENPIKAVRRMKTSPLTVEEITCIQEGLKLCKFDWMSVWQYIVPHRDPSLLPRQWRVALGTQKSYKLDAEQREKRRLYESKRRKLKATAPESCQDISSKEDCEAEIADRMDCSIVPYVHQAFLADWRPDTSTLNYSERISSTPGERILAHDANQHAFPSVSMFPQPFHSTSDLWSSMKGAPGATTPKPPVFCKTSSSKYYCRPYKSRKAKSTRLVKLAPDLPPVNLPASVRVVSQTAFNGFQCGTSKIYPPGGGLTAPGKDNSASQIPHGEKIGTIHPAEGARPMPKDSVTNSQLERTGTAEDRSLAAEKGTYADLQMHPLLFQVSEKGNMPYYPFNFSAGASSSFSFFSGRQPQINLSLFNSSQQQNHIDKSKNSTLRSGGIDFHPLLQKSNDTQSQSGSDAIQIESLVNSGVPDTANISSGLNDNSNEFDLNIDLSSVSESEKSRNLKAHDPKESQKTVASCATAMTPRENNVPYCQQGDRNPSPSSCELASSAPSAIPDINITRYDVDDVGDQSHPEIVMEQEELSDSEEDIEEHVEFECEEMDDSEEDDSSGCEQAPEVQNKEVLISSEENVAMQTACMKKPYEPRANSDTQVDSSLPKDNAIPNMFLMSDGMDDLSSSSWLSLDSSNPAPSKTMLQRDIASEDLTRRNFTITKAITDGRHSIDMVQQPSQGPHGTTPRKLGKHYGKFITDLNIALTAEKSDHDGDHEDG